MSPDEINATFAARNAEIARLRDGAREFTAFNAGQAKTIQSLREELQNLREEFDARDEDVKRLTALLGRAKPHVEMNAIDLDAWGNVERALEAKGIAEEISALTGSPLAAVAGVGKERGEG